MPFILGIAAIRHCTKIVVIELTLSAPILRGISAQVTLHRDTDLIREKRIFHPKSDICGAYMEKIYINSIKCLYCSAPI